MRTVREVGVAGAGTNGNGSTGIVGEVTISSSRIDLIIECYKNAALVTAKSNCQDSEVGFLLDREGTHLYVNSSGLKNAAL